MNSTLDYKGKTLLVNLILILLFDVNQISNITVQCIFCNVWVLTKTISCYGYVKINKQKKVLQLFSKYFLRNTYNERDF